MKGKKLLSLLLSAALVGTMVPTAALAAEGDEAENTPLVCTTDEGGAAESHEENCPLYEMPEEESEGLSILETVPPETAPTEENTLESTPANTEGDKTIPGWVDNNDGHPKYVRETFDFVEGNIAYSEVSDKEVEVAPWYWSWKGHNCAQHTDNVFAGTEYSNRSTLEIPATITHNGQTYTVVGIGDGAFFEMTGTEVTLSEGLTYIGEGAFSNASCTSISIPASVTSLQREAFTFAAFTSITFAEGSKLESIGDSAFCDCKITTLSLPSSVKSLGHTVFKSCDELNTVEIPASVTEIQTDTFDEYFDADANEGKGNVTFAEGSIFKLQDGVLYDSENLIRVLDWQENVVVPEGIKYIGADAFNAYSTQTPNNMETLKSIILPESLVSIGKMAFRACKSLESITIPENVSEIGDGAFSSCSSLATVKILGPVKELTGINGVFSGCTELKTITLPDTLTILGNRTFNGCKALETINLPESLTEIGERAFFQCTSLKNVNIPNGVKTVGKQVFGNCNSLELAVIPASVTSIGQQAFQKAFDDGDGGSLVMEGATPPQLGTNVMGTATTKQENVKVYYPAAAEAAYKATDLVDETDEGGYALKLTDASMILTTAKAADTNTLTLKTVTVPEGMTLTATSDKENVATVEVSERNLVVTGVAEGTATITATLKVGDYVVLEDTCTVTVTAEGAVLHSVEEPNVTMDDSISDENDKRVVNATANSVEADKTINDAARSEADKLTNDDTEKAELEQKAKDKGLTPDDGEKVTLYTQTFLDIQATNIDKSDSNISKITLNITPKVQVVASTATNSADIDIKTSNDDKDWNAVVVKEAEALTINTQAAITVQLPTSFAGQPVYVKHEASNGTYFYKATADAQGEITFTSTHGFSPFTFSLTNEAVAEVNDIGYASFQDAVDAAGDNATVEVLKNENLFATMSGESRTIYVKNGTKENNITVTINGTTKTIAQNQSETFTYTHSSSSGTTRYSVEVRGTTGGTVTASPTRAAKGATVTLTVRADEGYQLDGLTVTDSKGGTVKLTDKGSGTYTFTMPASKVTVQATFTQNQSGTLPFTDVKTGDWFYEAVQYVYDKGMMTGVSADRFAPASTTTRGMIVTILYRLENEPAVSGDLPFTDVERGAWYADAVAWAAANDIVNGTSATTFAPNSPITREQMATMLYRFAQYKGMDAVTLQEHLTGYPDGDQVSDYAIPAMNWAVGQGLIAGMENGTLVPQGSATRAQVATILMRFCESIG